MGNSSIIKRCCNTMSQLATLAGISVGDGHILSIHRLKPCKLGCLVGFGYIEQAPDGTPKYCRMGEWVMRICLMINNQCTTCMYLIEDVNTKKGKWLCPAPQYANELWSDTKTDFIKLVVADWSTSSLMSKLEAVPRIEGPRDYMSKEWILAVLSKLSKHGWISKKDCKTVEAQVEHLSQAVLDENGLKCLGLP